MSKKNQIDQYYTEENELSHKVDKYVAYTTEDPVYQVHEFNIDMKMGHIYLFGEESYIDANEGEEPGVEYSMANRFIKNLNMLMRKKNIDSILIHMKTCGGDWVEGMAIYNAIKACPKPVVILNYTHARSMSSIILQAADKRVMMPDSYFMFHEGEGSVAGTEKQIRAAFKFDERIRDRMINIYVDAMKTSGKFSKRSRKFIYEWIEEQMKEREDVYLTEKEAVEYGFADSIFGEDGCYDWQDLMEVDEEEEGDE